MTKLEECARALAKSESGDPSYYDKADLITRGAWKRDVRAVLLALREPDEGMVQAGEAVAVQAFVPAGQFTPMTFTAMIDAVLATP